MKVGDLVELIQKKSQPAAVPRVGTVVNVWRQHTGKITTIDVMWGDDQGNQIRGYRPSLFRVVNEV